MKFSVFAVVLLFGAVIGAGLTVLITNSTPVTTTTTTAAVTSTTLAPGADADPVAELRASQDVLKAELAALQQRVAELEARAGADPQAPPEFDAGWVEATIERLHKVLCGLPTRADACDTLIQPAE